MHGTRTESNRSELMDKRPATNSSMKQLPTVLSSWNTWWRLVLRLTLAVVVGVLTFYLLIQLTHTLLNMELPHTLQQVQSIAITLDEKTHRGTWSDYFAVVAVFTSIYLWQQAFSMPGPILFNLLAGKLYGVVVATIWTSYLTAVGSTLAYFLGLWILGSPVLKVPFVKRRVEVWQAQMDQEQKEIGLFWWLLSIRLLPFSPYWFINMVSPIVGVSIIPFFWSTFLGSMPYNYICTQAGEVLGELTTTSDMLTVSLIVKLLLVSFVSLIPLIWRKSMQRRLQKGILQDKEDVEMGQ